MTAYHKMTTQERTRVEERKTEILQKGWYAKPRCLLWMLKEGVLSKSEYQLMDILLHLENLFVAGEGGAVTSKRGRCFFCSNKDILAYRMISEKTFAKAKKTLKRKGFIDYTPGHTAKATEYRILDIDNFCSG